MLIYLPNVEELVTESPVTVTMRIRHYFTTALTPSSTASSYDLVSVEHEMFNDAPGGAPDDDAAADHRRSKTLPRHLSDGLHRGRGTSEVVANAHVAAFTVPKKPARRSFSSPGSDVFQPEVVQSSGHLLTFDPKSPDPISFLAPPAPPPRVLPPRQLASARSVPPDSPPSYHHEDGLGGEIDRRVSKIDIEFSLM